MLEYLPDALWDDILVRLPHTTLVHLSSVSKAWCSFIVRPTFILHYSLSNPTPPPLLLIHTPLQCCLFNTPPSPSPVTPLLQPYPSSFRFVESLNGIVCLIERSFDQDRAIVLWNPSVRRHLTLQIRTPNHLAIGFGFDSNNHDFKVIRFFHPSRVELYSLNEGSWRVIQFSIGVGQFADTSCFLNGNVHWIVTPRYPHKSNRLLIFNVGEEKFKIMELPPELVYVSLLTLKVTVIEDCLSVLRYNRVQCMLSINSSCDIWTMREYGVVDSWTKFRTVNLKAGRLMFGLSTSRKVLVTLVTRTGREFGVLFSFDNESREIMDLKIHIHGGVVTACEYTQSLVLLDGKRDLVFCPANKRIKHDTGYYSCPKLSRTSTTHPRGGSPRLM